MRETLVSPDAHIYELFDRSKVISLLNDHLEGRQNRRLLIWSLLCVENWLDIFLAKGWESLNG